MNANQCRKSHSAQDLNSGGDVFMQTMLDQLWCSDETIEGVYQAIDGPTWSCSDSSVSGGGDSSPPHRNHGRTLSLQTPRDEGIAFGMSWNEHQVEPQN